MVVSMETIQEFIRPDIDKNSSKLVNQPLIVINLQSFEYRM